MAGSSFGEAFRISTWGESHGAALGVVVDGVPAGLRLDTNRIQEFMDRRKPGQSKFTTARKEADAIEAAVAAVLKEGYRTTDIYSEGCTKVGTDKMGDLIAERV